MKTCTFGDVLSSIVDEMKYDPGERFLFDAKMKTINRDIVFLELKLYSFYRVTL